MLIICCINAGNYCQRGKEYVENLYDMIRRNLSTEVKGEFHCFTDDPQEYTKGIIKRSLPHDGLKGWWNKLSLFKKSVFNEKDRIIYFDLDTCIVGGLDDLIKYDGSFAILRDAYRPDGLQSAVIAWTPSSIIDQIWQAYGLAGFPDVRGGDQTIIETYWNNQPHKKIDILQDIYPNQFRSYKVDCSYDIPQGTRVVFFHGYPRPHECQHNWVEKIWKIGGGTTLEMELIGNVSNEILTCNVENALKLSNETLADQYMIEKNDQHLVIVGGGPSLSRDIEDIRRRQQNGQIIWALNNTFKYLMERQIYPDAHILLDARYENIEFVPDRTQATLLYSFQCHTDVLIKANIASPKVILWAPSLPGMFDALKKYERRAALIGVGSSVGLKALGLAQLFGFKHIHLYGYDSSYENNNNHAYPQALNDNERKIEVMLNDKIFTCAPWMARQVTEFRDNISGFIKLGMDFTVHGDGLLPYMASLMEIG